MKKVFLILVALINCIGLSSQSITKSQPLAQIEYIVDLTNHKDDIFHVTVLTNKLSDENNIYNFAATAPGTYHILDFGRFVQSFYAYDKNGNELITKQISTNRWEIKKSGELSKIVYTMEDSYDSKIRNHFVPSLCGMGIQQEFIVFNTFGVLGYFENLQSNPVKLRIDFKADWKLGTAMDIDTIGHYQAETYDRLADSPVLLGELTNARTKVNNIDVEVFLYTPDTLLLSADSILNYVEDILLSVGKFINYSPVKYYKFLMVLLDHKTFSELKQAYSGGLEHSYSSLYILPLEERHELKSLMAHEFLHILSPLNLHSEIIHKYNFTIPTASEHLWLYEGVTEWASWIIQLRNGLITIDEYLKTISKKLNESDKYKQDISLSQMSLKVYDDKIKNQFFNFYERGAVTATLLDIKLLELSNGKKGLREVYLQLLTTYGKNKPFPENEFFDIIVEMTYPEIKQFINDYIRGTKPLPCKEYFDKLGINYFAEKKSRDTIPDFGFGVILNNKKYKISKVSKGAYQYGIRKGDRIIKLMGLKINSKNLKKIIQNKNSIKTGDPYNIVVKRNNKKIKLSSILLPGMEYHIFEIIKEPTYEQKFLRKKWMRNL